MLERELKRKKLVTKYSEKRKVLLNQLKSASSLEEIFELNEKIQKLPKNSSRIRIRNRCWKTGRPRGFFRQHPGDAHRCLWQSQLPGVGEPGAGLCP